MSQIVKLNDILASLEETEKVASDSGQDDDSSNAGHRASLRDILSREEDQSESPRGPVDDLEKIAQDLHEAEGEALTKEAHLYGAAVCDGFMSRLSQYEESSEYLPQNEKVAHDTSMVKTAEDAYNLAFETAVDFAKEAEDAYDAGLSTTLEFAKEAEEAYDAGLSDAIEFAKEAEEAYDAGLEAVDAAGNELAYEEAYGEVMEKAAELLQEAGMTDAVDDLVKTAFDQGYGDAMEKVAEAAWVHGYNDTVALLQE